MGWEVKMNEYLMKWDEFKSWIGSIQDVAGSFMFRGQSDATWKLQTTFHRFVIGTNITMSSYVDEILPQVHRYVSGHYNEIFNLENRQEFGAFMALLQHHGFPTPLLDWTLSPYIAAYFAFRNEPTKILSADHVKIYAFGFGAWNQDFERLSELKEPKQHVSFLAPFPKHNSRLIPQQGLFTVTNVSDMEEYLETRSKQANKSYLFHGTFSTSERLRVLRDLELMGITDMMLFPGMDGICRTLREKFFEK